MRLGSITLHSVPARLIDGHYPRLQADGVIGLIGADILKFFVLTIDPQKMTITLDAPSSHPPVDQDGMLEFYFMGYFPTINASIDTRSNELITIDTGFSGGLSLPERVVKSLGYKINFDDNFARGLDGTLKEDGTVIVKNLLLGTTKYKNIPCDVRLQCNNKKATEYSFLAQSNEFLLGNEYLRNFRIIIDYPHGKIFLENIEKKNKPN